MALVKERHNTLFKSLTSELITDLGRTIYIHLRTSTEECTWCYFDAITKASSGIAQTGKVWSTHPRYYGSNIRCPECDGRGLLNQPDIRTIDKVVVEDLSGERWEAGKFFSFKNGTKRLIGKLSDVLNDATDTNSGSIFYNCIKIIIDGDNHRFMSIDEAGLKDKHLFIAIVERTDKIDTTSESSQQG